MEGLVGSDAWFHSKYSFITTIRLEAKRLCTRLENVLSFVFRSKSALISFPLCYKCDLFVLITGCYELHQLSALQLILCFQWRSMKVIHHACKIPQEINIFANVRHQNVAGCRDILTQVCGWSYRLLPCRKDRGRRQINIMQKCTEGLEMGEQKEVHPGTQTEETDYNNKKAHVWQTAVGGKWEDIWGQERPSVNGQTEEQRTEKRENLAHTEWGSHNP